MTTEAELPFFDLESERLGNRRRIGWQWPAEVENSTEDRRLLILLDGEFYLQRVNAAPIVARWQLSLGDRAPLVVFVSHIDADTRFIECPCHPPFVPFITEELLPRIRSEFPISRASRAHAIGGLSYTGLLAAYVAIEAGESFGSVICQSASFWWNDVWMPGWIANRPALPVAFSISCGSRETDTHVQHREDLLQVVSQLESNRAMRDALLAKGYAVTYREFDGGHEMAAWQRDLPAALASLSW